MVKVYLHAGLPKTGTTTMQNWLMENAAELGKLGIYTFPNSGLAHRLAIEGITLPERLDQPDIPVIMGWRLEDAKSALERARDDANVKLIVISSEYFFDASPEAVKRAFSEMSLEDVAILFVLRRQDRLLESGFSQSVREMGWTRPFNIPHYNANCDWYLLASSWAQVFGRDRIVLRSYDEIVASGEPFIPTVFKDLDSDLSAYAKEHAGNGVIANPSLSAGLLEFKRLANVAGAAGILPLVEAASEHGVGGPRFRFNPAMAKIWLDHYRESNVKLAREFLNRDGDLFDESDLNEDSPGADYTGSLPIETIAMLLAFLAQDQGQARKDEADRADNLARELARNKAAVASNETALAEGLDEVRHLIGQLGERIEELHRSRASDADELLERHRKLATRVRGLEEFLASSRGAVAVLRRRLVKALKRS